ncbi:hypothetical protein [Micromonospora sp. RTP1Z1]|uniref:hypothetical protein n=1 Tax=Micromonospora sp. RTP1Z1 TaxID=2994043 RepID=UPI0029C8D94D|nr:hypothetical protein [Micromonospora sp. RTP1Z1]
MAVSTAIDRSHRAGGRRHAGEGSRITGRTGMDTLAQRLRESWPRLGPRELRAAAAAAQTRVRQAGAGLAAGGEDNATAVVVRVHPAIPTPR